MLELAGLEMKENCGIEELIEYVKE